MDKNYVLSTLFVTMSCSTVAITSPFQEGDGYGIISQEQSISIPEEPYRYLFSTQESSYISSIRKEVEDLETMLSFAKKMLANEASIDEDIQRVIENHFWDML